MQLSELQKHFCNTLYEENDALLMPHILSNGIPIPELLAIYRNTVTTNLLNVLRMAYPVVYRLVGEEFFHFLGKSYIQATRSQSGNLDGYGDKMAAFLAVLPEVESLPYLPDMARLEWACNQAYHAEEAEEINVESLMKTAPESYGDLHFQLHPSCVLLHSPYPLYTIWQVNQDGYEGSQSVDLGAGECYLLVIRDKACAVKLVVLDKAEYNFLHALQADKNLYEAYEEAEKSSASFNLSEGLRKNVAGGVFMAYNIKA